MKFDPYLSCMVWVSVMASCDLHSQTWFLNQSVLGFLTLKSWFCSLNWVVFVDSLLES